MSELDLDVIKRLYEAFNQANFPAVLEFIDPAIEWIAAENSPLADHSPYHGLEEVRQGVFERIAAGFASLTIRVDELFGAGDKVVMLGFYEGVLRATGKPVHAQVAHIWTLSAGKAVKFQQYTDTYQLAAAGK